MVRQHNAVAHAIGSNPVSMESAPPVGGDGSTARLQKAQSLAGRLDRDAVQKLLEYLGDGDPIVRWQAGVALSDTAIRLRKRARLGSSIWRKRTPELTFSGLLSLLQQGLRHSDPERRAATADALALWDHETAVTLLIQAMDDGEPRVRASAAEALGKIGDKAAVSALVSALSDASFWVRRAAADALGAIADPRVVSALEQALADPQRLVRASVICALGHMPTSRARKILEERARDDDAAIRWYAARSLGRIGNVGSLPVLLALQEDNSRLYDRTVAEVAASARQAIDARERGLLNRVRRVFHFARSHLTRVRHKDHYAVRGSVLDQGRSLAGQEESQ